MRDTLSRARIHIAREVLKGQQAQLVSLTCPHCGAHEVRGGGDAVFFSCKSCQAILQPQAGKLTVVPCLWEKSEEKPAEGAMYVPFWMFRTEVSFHGKQRAIPSLAYPADFMVPASVSPGRPVSIVRLGHKATLDGATHQYSTSKLDIEPDLGRYSRDDAAEAVELIFLSIERELFSRAPGTKYEVKPRYKNLCFFVWEKSRFDFLHAPDEHVLAVEPNFARLLQEKKVGDFLSLLSEGLTRKRFGVPF